MRQFLIAITVVASLTFAAFLLWPSTTAAPDAVGGFSESDEELLTYIPDDAFAVLVVRPEKMFEVPGLSEDELADLAGPTRLKPSDIKELIVAVLPNQDQVTILISINLREPIDPKSFQRKIAPGSTKFPADFPAYDAGRTRGLSF